MPTREELLKKVDRPANLMDGQVETRHFRDNSITTGKITAGAITTGKLAAGSVTATELAADSVTSAKIQADAVTADKIAANAVTADEIAANAVTASEIAADAVTAVKILAGSITADKLEATLVLASRIVGGTLGAGRIEFGLDPDTENVTLTAFGSDGTTVTFLIDAQSGDVTLKGHVLFGTGSQLRTDDMVELSQQPATGFQAGAIVQSAPKTYFASGSPPSGSTIVPTWTAPTTKGNTLLAVVAAWNTSGAAPTFTAPGGWTQVATVTRAGTAGNFRLSVYKIENSAARSGNESFSVSVASCWRLGRLIEYSGLATVDLSASNSGSSGTVDSGTTGTTTQTDETWIAFLCNVVDNAGVSGTPGSSFVARYEDSSNLFGTPTRPQVLVETASRNVTATGTANTGDTLDASSPWAGIVVAIKAKAVGAEAADTNLLKLYAKALGSGTALATIDDTGTEHVLTGFHGVRAWRSAAATHTNNGGWQTVPFDTEDEDSENAFASNTFTVPWSGVWEIVARVTFSGSAGFRRAARLNKNAGTIIDLGEYADGFGANPLPAPLVYFKGRLTLNDTIIVEGFQNTGGNLAYSVGTEKIWFTAEFKGV
jgi:hypothetical protein